MRSQAPRGTDGADATAAARDITIACEPLAVDRVTMAKLLAISTRKLDELVAQRAIPFTRLGGERGSRILFPLAQTREWLARMTEGGEGAVR